MDIRWTVLCDLFLILIADSVYDARSRVLLESVALKLGLGWLDVVKFERRVTEALEIQEGVEKLEQQESIQDVQKNSKKRRYMMLGLATLGAPPCTRCRILSSPNTTLSFEVVALSSVCLLAFSPQSLGQVSELRCRWWVSLGRRASSRGLVVQLSSRRAAS